MDQYEKEFERRLNAVEVSARSCADHGYTELALHYLVGTDFELRDRFQAHPTFWNSVASALQASSIMALGRMYDEDRKSDTIGELLVYAKNHPGLFSANALKLRKSKVLAPELAEEYVSGAYQYTRDSLTPLWTEFKEMQRLYLEKIDDKRDKVFAHNDRISPAQRYEMFVGLLTRDFEKLVVFPMRVCRALFSLYMNGSEPIALAPETVTGHVLSAERCSDGNNWDHSVAALATKEFLDWMRKAPLPSGLT